jgi:polyamine oxidase
VLFAGEATSTEFYGYLHGAYFEGMHAGESVAKCLNADARSTRKCEEEKFYEVLKGTTDVRDYSKENGWYTSSSQTIGDTDLPDGGG